MLAKLRHQIVLKLLAVLIGMILWLVVYNVNNPMETRNLEVDILFLNEISLASNSLRIINNYNRQATIQVRGRRSQLDQILIRDFRAVADFNDVTDTDVNRIPIKAVQYHGQQDIVYRVKEGEAVEIIVDRVLTGDFPIYVEEIGQLEEPYQVVNIFVRPENYSVKEISTLIQRISHAVVRLNLEGLRGNRTLRVYTEVYGLDGRIINELNNTFIVDVTIEVAKVVEVAPVLSGFLPVDYVLTASVTTPRQVLVSGPAAELAQLNTLQTEPISLSGRTAFFSTAARIQGIPENSRVVGRIESVEVSVHVEQLMERTFSFNQNEIEFRYADTSGNFIYIIAEPTLRFTLKGRQARLNEIPKDFLAPYIDVSGMRDEARILPVRITVPLNTTQVTYPSTEVIVYRLLSINIDRARITLYNQHINLNYQIIQPVFNLRVQGFSDDIAKVTPDLINPRINVGPLGVGTHTVPVEMVLPDGVTRFGANTVSILVTEK